MANAVLRGRLLRRDIDHPRGAARIDVGERAAQRERIDRREPEPGSTGHAHVSADSLAPPPIRAPDLDASTTARATALLTFSSNTLGTM